MNNLKDLKDIHRAWIALSRLQEALPAMILTARSLGDQFGTDTAEQLQKIHIEVLSRLNWIETGKENNSVK